MKKLTRQQREKAYLSARGLRQKLAKFPPDNLSRFDHYDRNKVVYYIMLLEGIAIPESVPVDPLQRVESCARETESEIIRLLSENYMSDKHVYNMSRAVVGRERWAEVYPEVMEGKRHPIPPYYERTVEKVGCRAFLQGRKILIPIRAVEIQCGATEYQVFRAICYQHGKTVKVHVGYLAKTPQGVLGFGKTPVYAERAAHRNSLNKFLEETS